MPTPCNKKGFNMATGVSYGTLRILDTFNYGQLSVIEYGIDKAFDEYGVYLDAHNENMRQVVADVVEGITDKPRHRFGGAAGFTMGRIDKEFGIPDAAKTTTGYTIGLPINTYAPQAIQWTQSYFKRATVEEFNAQLQAQLAADVDNFRKEILRTLFTPTNTTAWLDADTDGTTLDLVALLNADSRDIPRSEQTSVGDFNGATHTHYKGAETLTQAVVVALYQNVMEHYSGGTARVYINAAQEATVRGFTDFVPLQDVRIVQGIGTDYLSPSVGTLDIFNTYDRMIGIMNGGPEVWVRPWVPAGYVFAFIAGKPKPLMIRRDPVESFDLQVVVLNDVSSRRAKLEAYSVERTFGMGVVNRTNGAVLSINGAGNGTTYVAPTIA